MPLALIALWDRAKSIRPAAWGWIAAIIAVLVLLSTCTVLGIAEDRRQEAAVKAANADRGIREEVGEVRAADKATINSNTEKLNDAIATLPDGVPSDRRIALACQRLRNDGHVILPAVCGPSADGKAPARPHPDYQRGLSG